MTAILRHSRTWIAGCVLLVLVFPFLVGQSSYYMGLAATVAMYAIASIALNLLTGYGGQVSVGHSGFLVIGAYAAAILSASCGFPFWLALPAAGIITAVIGLVIGLPAVRLRGHFLAVATLGFGLSMPAVALNWKSLTHGYSGMAVMRPDAFSSDLAFYYVIAVITFFIIWLAVNIARSRMGRAFVAVRDSEVAATANGINVAFYKATMFVVSAFFTGIAGGLYAYWVGFVSPNDYTIVTSFLLLAMIVIGGLASIWGAVLGALLLTVIPHFTDDYVGVTDLVIGIAVMAVILLRPAGLASLLTPWKKSGRDQPAATDNESASA